WFLMAGLARVFGCSLALGRVFSFVTALLLAVLIGWLVKQSTKDGYVALIASLFYLASPYVYYQAHVFGDIMSLGIIFSLLGIYLVSKYEGSNKIYLSLPLFILAFYTKQPFVVAPAAACLYLFFKDKRTALKFGGTYALLVLTIFLMANCLTSGNFYFHTIAGNRFAYNLVKMLFEYITTIQVHFVLLGFAAAFALNKLLKRELDLFSFYFCLAALVAVGVGKAGASAISYMLEPLAVACVLFSRSLVELQCRFKDYILARSLLVVLLILQLAALAHAPYTADSTFRLSSTPTEDARLIGEKVSRYIQSTKGRVLSQDAGLVVINGKELLVDPILVTQLSKGGMWDQTGLVTDIADGRFSLVLLKFDLEQTKSSGWFTDEMLSAIRNNYCLDERIGENYLYKPKRGHR
ncbi:MAG: glycosyltransferase family 39 protein, partial [Candidatus Margulisbacteria bacterium]|nr:glycosyltransferase family 39 protein [Candidatus Margulisiibacteriota bacterium]